ncbi:glycosyltransferase family 4 protein [Reyranella sp. CPCC 100927]|uniref:glycosyltransferase family 4 protein n=1 Tax=Reyranella sp. CPCC 100927 TaxID=2599616 RepID=UPI0011B6EF88|nr:glycosyltransferase family 4 protein [Reyranella sp. CPCC 100927]TWT12967.1 glycosyltransferase family 4 protein [Reyranella sp. CPCC 100927]
MTAAMVNPTQDAHARPAKVQRFDRVALTSVFGDPLNPRTWSGAPKNVADGLQRLGIGVEGIHPHLGKAGKLQVAAGNIITGRGRPISGEQILRSELARRRLAAQVADAAAQLGVRHVLHTGTMDLPAIDVARGVKHYLYCDHSWALAREHHIEAARYPRRALDAYEQLERQSLAGLEHIFTFGTYVRDNLIDHYGVPPDRVTAVGSGMGRIAPYFGSKDYARPSLLFVAKHYFRAKGGVLLIDAFLRAQAMRPDLTLTVIGDPQSRPLVPRNTAITFHTQLPWEELQRLYHQATLLVQPMLNDPWGQVYLEALVSRAPVLGLRRHGLPEIVANGRYGFLVDHADPGLLADAILDACADPDRLARMGTEGQQHTLASYSWDVVAEKIAFP